MLGLEGIPEVSQIVPAHYFIDKKTKAKREKAQGHTAASQWVALLFPQTIIPNFFLSVSLVSPTKHSWEALTLLT